MADPTTYIVLRLGERANDWQIVGTRRQGRERQSSSAQKRRPSSSSTQHQTPVPERSFKPVLRDYNVTALDLPIRRDRRDEYVPDECIVCTNQADEFHHWAPTAIFPDWPYSLGIYLCRDHHHEWHARMRAHGLRWPHELTPK